MVCFRLADLEFVCHFWGIMIFSMRYGSEDTHRIFIALRLHLISIGLQQFMAYNEPQPTA